MLPKGLKNSLNKIREISSDIYQKYIPIIDDDTDISSFASPILTYPEVYNEFCGALINRIVYTAIETRTFNNPLRGLEGNVMPLGYAGQEIFVNAAKGRQYNPEDFAGILKKYESDIKVQYLVKNMDLQYCVTIIRTKLKEAFVSWDNLDQFITGLINSLYNGMYIDEFRFTKALVSSAYAGNLVQVETVSNPSSSEALAKTFLTKARELFLNFQMPSTKYNAWAKVGGSGRPVTTWTEPSDIVILLRNDIRSYLDVNVMASAFNIDSATLLGNIYPVDNFDVYSDDGEKVFDGANVFALIADRNWFKIRPIDQFMEQDYNANNRAMQYYLNNIKMYEYSLFANGVVFATAENTVQPTAIKFVKDGEEISTLSIAENGDPVEVQLVTTPYSANGTITIASSAEGKATAALKSGETKVVVITPVDDGSANVTASANSGAVTATLAVTITAAAAAAGEAKTTRSK